MFKGLSQKEEFKALLEKYKEGSPLARTIEFDEEITFHYFSIIMVTEYDPFGNEDEYELIAKDGKFYNQDFMDFEDVLKLTNCADIAPTIIRPNTWNPFVNAAILPDFIASATKELPNLYPYTPPNQRINILGTLKTNKNKSGPIIEPC